MIILEFGSGDTCKNDKNQIADMITQLAEYDTDRKCIIKWQLFKNLSHVASLSKENFDYAYKFAENLGFKTTASVFDRESLDFLLKYNTPFLKIACQTQKYDFRKAMNNIIQDVPVTLPIIASVESSLMIEKVSEQYPRHYIEYLCCVPIYPALRIQYVNNFYRHHLKEGISDHTIGHTIYNLYQPKIYEVHYILSHQTSLDKQWSIGPEELKSFL